MVRRLIWDCSLRVPLNWVPYTHHLSLLLQTRRLNLVTGVFVFCIAQLLVGIMMISFAIFGFTSCRASYLQILTTTCLPDLFERAYLVLKPHFWSQSFGISLVVFFSKLSLVAAWQRHSQTSPLAFNLQRTSVGLEQFWVVLWRLENLVDGLRLVLLFPECWMYTGFFLMNKHKANTLIMWWMRYLKLYCIMILPQFMAKVWNLNHKSSFHFLTQFLINNSILVMQCLPEGPMMTQVLCKMADQYAFQMKWEFRLKLHQRS